MAEGKHTNFKQTCSESLARTYDDCIYRETANMVRKKYRCVMPYFNKFDVEDVCQTQNFSYEKNEEFLSFYKGNYG